MLAKRDPIFWAASAIFVLALALAFADERWMLLLAAAYLLRPTLHSLGFAKTLIDERQLQLQYRASNIGFAVMVAGVVTVILVLYAKGDHTWEMLVAILVSGLAARALAGLLMVGDARSAGVRIIVSIGLLFVLFGVIEGGEGGAVSHVLPGLAVIALGLAAKRFPRPVAYLTLVFTAGFAVAVVRMLSNRAFAGLWGTAVAFVLISLPAVAAAVCLLRSSDADSEPSLSMPPRSAA